MSREKVIERLKEYQSHLEETGQLEPAELIGEAVEQMKDFDFQLMEIRALIRPIITNADAIIKQATP